MKLSPNAATLLSALRDHVEGCEVTENDGSVWRTVYLDNATSRLPFDGPELGGLFGTLKRKGLYRKLGEGSAFGEVKI
jgi:hypothetical protein